MTPKRAKFIEYYFGECLLNASASAQKAGYKCGRGTGSRLAKLLAPLLAVKQVEYESKFEMSGKEVREKLTTIARQDGHKDQVRALELLAKISGQLSENIKVTQDRTQLEAQLVTALEQLKSQAPSSHTAS